MVDGGKAARSALVTAEVPCAFMVTPLRRDVLGTAGAEQVAVTTAPGCAWTPASESRFLAVTAGTAGAAGIPRGRLSGTSEIPSFSNRNSWAAVAFQPADPHPRDRLSPRRALVS